MNMKTGIIIILLACIGLNSACRKKEIPPTQEEFQLVVPNGFPALPQPADNAFTSERWALGKQLFFDKRLSKGQDLSCASCHLPARGFSDTVAFSRGDGGRLASSNSPSLANVAYHPYYTRAGGVPTLEMQIAVPIQEHNEFNTNMVDIVALMAQDSSLQQRARNAYGRSFDAFVLTRAIATFERSLLSGNSRYDKYGKQGVQANWTASEERGRALFFSEKAQCATCHADFDFTDYRFANNGLYTQYADSGRMRLTKNEADRAMFKVPSLRNVAVTAPYMHDGSLKSLAEVVEHYNQGGKPHVNKSPLIKPLQLTPQEKEDLIAFLQALTDFEFLSNKHLHNE